MRPSSTTRRRRWAGIWTTASSARAWGWRSGKLRRPAAAAALRRAVALDPASSDFRQLLHGVLRWLGNDVEDEEQLRAGLARESDSPSLLAALGQNLIGQGRLDEGLECCRRALAVDPGHHDARLARGRANFLAGRYAALLGLTVTRQVKGLDRRPKGTSGQRVEGAGTLPGSRSCSTASRGWGDVIQYARYASLVAEGGARVVLACKPRLVGLLGRIRGIDKVVPSDHPPATDRLALLAPGRACRLGAGRRFDSGAVPVSTAACAADARAAPGAAVPGRDRLGGAAPGRSRTAAGPAAWRTSRRSSSCRARSSSAFRWGHPPGSYVRAGVGWFTIRATRWTALEATADALMEVDLVITVDTMLAHLAGALGRPVWNAAGVRPGLALDARPRRHTLVSDNATVPATKAQRLGQRLPRGAPRAGGASGASGRAGQHA